MGESEEREGGGGGEAVLFPSAAPCHGQGYLVSGWMGPAGPMEVWTLRVLRRTRPT